MHEIKEHCCTCERDSSGTNALLGIASLFITIAIYIWIGEYVADYAISRLERAHVQTKIS